MIELPAVHLAIIQPAGYVHSLGFIDQARFVRHQLRRFGVPVTIGKNRLREDAVNIVFGAHLGFPLEWKTRHTCAFFNLEQLGQGGAKVSASYLALLRGSAVIDYDAANVAAYCSEPQDVPVVPFLHAPYLAAETLPLEQRPIDLLFFGSLNERRKALIRRVESTGVTVSLFDKPIYGEERDAFVRQAKAVLNFSFYESSRFEQARASQCLSLGTPVVSERHPASNPHPAYDEAVCWIEDDRIEAYFREHFLTPAWYDEARARLAAFPAHDPVGAYADLMVFLAGYRKGDLTRLSTDPWQPSRLNLGSGKDYKPTWLNIDILERAQPDAVLDLAAPLSLPIRLPTLGGGEVLLGAGTLERIYANNVLEHVPDLPALMTNALALLCDGGEFEIEVPHERAPTAWQDPTHVRAMNENSWLYYTDWFWYLGWFEHRFDMVASTWLDSSLKSCEQPQAAFMRVVLRKRETTPLERTHARAMRPDFGGIADDLPIDAIAGDEAPAVMAADEAEAQVSTLVAADRAAPVPADIAAATDGTALAPGAAPTTGPRGTDLKGLVGQVEVIE